MKLYRGELGKLWVNQHPRSFIKEKQKILDWGLELEQFTKLTCKDNKLRILQDIDFVYGIPVRRTGYISINEHIPNPDPFDYLNLVFLFLTLEFSDGMIYSVMKHDQILLSDVSCSSGVASGV